MKFIYSSILKAVNNPSILRQVHAHMIISGASHNNVYISNNLIKAYTLFGQTSHAHKIFDKMLNKNVVSWTILISGFTKKGLFYEAVDLFSEMVASGLLPNEVTISSILPAFANLGVECLGKSVHGFWVRRGFEHNVVVDTCLVDMYARFGCVCVARKLFDEMPVRNLVSWNVLVSGYANNGMSCEAVKAFNLMRLNGVLVDYFTIMSLISASCRGECGKLSASIHGLIFRVGYNNEHQIQTALIDMYTSGNFVEEAYGVFDEMSVKDVVAWTLMLEAFSSSQCWSRAIEHLSEMMSVHCVALDSTAIVSILSSCSGSAALLHGRRVHALVMKQGFINDVFVGSALIDMYANCGDTDSGRRYFDGAERKDVACWNTMIRAMGANGNGKDAIDLLGRMEGLGLKPNESTLVSILFACSHCSMVDEGLQIFYHMVESLGVVPNLQHYACIVDLLSRSGRLDEAHFVMDKITLQPHSGVYGPLLSACRVYGNTEMGAEIFRQLQKLDPIDAGHFCSVSNMYASVANWEGTKMSRVALRSLGVKKVPGYSF